MGVFSFRAECTHDTIAFKQCCIDAGIDVGLQINMTQFPDAKFPDVDIELSADTSLKQLQDIARNIPDGHVMLQTLRECPLKDNSLIRDDIE